MPQAKAAHALLGAYLAHAQGRHDEALKRIGRGDRHLRRVLARGPMSLRVREAGEILQALGIPAEVWAQDSEARGAWLLLRQIAGDVEPPKFAKLQRAAHRAVRNGLWTPVDRARATVQRGQLAIIEDQLGRNLPTAARRARALIEQSSRGGGESIGITATALGKLGSTYRLAGATREAAAIYLPALELSAWAPAARPDVLRRVSVVIATTGRFSASLRVSSQAAAGYGALHDLTGIGKVAADEISVWEATGNVGAALGAAAETLRLIPQEYGGSWRSTAWAARAKYCTNTDKAIDLLALAHAELPAGSKQAEAVIRWTEASIYRKRGELGQAAERLVGVAEDLGNPLDQAIAAIDLAETLLDLNRPIDACAIATVFADLATPLRSNRLALAVVVKLGELAKAGQLALAHLEIARQVIKRSKPCGARAPW